MRFGRWHRLDRAAAEAPSAPGVLQVKIASGLIDYPTGKSAMIRYGAAPDVKAAVADIARSLANDALSLTTLAEAAAALRLPLAPSEGDASLLDVIALVSAWPAALVLAVLAFVLMFLGRRRRPARGQPSRR